MQNSFIKIPILFFYVHVYICSHQIRCDSVTRMGKDDAKTWEKYKGHFEHWLMSMNHFGIHCALSYFSHSVFIFSHSLSLFCSRLPWLIRGDYLPNYHSLTYRLFFLSLSLSLSLSLFSSSLFVCLVLRNIRLSYWKIFHSFSLLHCGCIRIFFSCFCHCYSNDDEITSTKQINLSCIDICFVFLLRSE